MNSNTPLKVICSTEQIVYPLTGVGRYTYELTKELYASKRLADIKFYNNNLISSKPPNIPNNVPTPYYGMRKFAKNNKIILNLYRKLKPMQRAFDLRSYKDYIYHGTGYMLPKFSGKKVVSVHDLSVFTWSQCHINDTASFLRKEISNSIKNADRVITISEFIKKQICNFFDFPSDRITSIPLACGQEFYPRTENEVQPILSKYSIDYKQYSLFVGTIEPRKNIANLLDAYNRLADEIKYKYPLVIVGHQGWESTDIHNKMAQFASKGWLKYLGFLPNDDIPVIYASAKLFIFPSLYEGFGLPILEAMASEVPVICSNSSSLPEVAGDAALMCAPEDVEHLSDNIETGLLDENWQRSAILEGTIQGQKYSWKKCADQTIDVYQSI